MGAGEALVELDVFVGLGGEELGVGGEVLVLAVADDLGGAILGEGEVLGGEAVDEVALLVLDGDGFDDELGFDGERVGAGVVGGLVLADLLGGQRGGEEGVEEGEMEGLGAGRGFGHGDQNRKRMVVWRLRMEFTPAGTPNWALFTQVTHPVKTA